MTFGSLFSGIGGLDLGLERAGMRCIWQCEIDPYARRVLAKHWPGIPCYEDVRMIDGTVERPDLVCGGFPCQDVSNAGKRAGIDGQRSGLWSEFARVIRILRPGVVLVENTPGLLARGMGRVLGDLATLGYDAEWESVPASSLGAPFEGDRVFICASYRTGRQNEGRLNLWPKPEHGTQWLSEPGFCRVVDGVSGRVGNGGGNVETAALANAVVPQVAEYIARRILESLTP